MGDKLRGLFNKFIVRRVDQTDEPEGKHFACQYLVLDLTHDKHAHSAAMQYAETAREDGYERLAEDIENMVLNTAPSVEGAEALLYENGWV